MMAQSYRKMAQDGKITKEVAEKRVRIYEFLATCDTDDLCAMVDSSAFNDIIRAYLKRAVNNSVVSNKTKEKVLEQLTWVFDGKLAKELLENE